MSFSILNDICTQVLFRVEGGGVYAGIRLPNGDVINGGDGDIYKENEVEIVETFEMWVDLTEEIIGDYGM